MGRDKSTVRPDRMVLLSFRRGVEPPVPSAGLAIRVEGATGNGLYELGGLEGNWQLCRRKLTPFTPQQ